MPVLEAMIDQAVSASATNDELTELIATMGRVVSNAEYAKFFVTRSLRIGLAPIGAATGDRIAILGSGDAPFLLRPVPRDYVGEEAYRIIGGCEVDGTATPTHVISEHVTSEYRQA
jgi:hypothetical protein